MSLDLVSIVMPNYNCERFVKETIFSVINQTYSNWELLFVDDNSNDQSLNIVKEIAKTEKRIRIFENKENMGAAYSRNLAIQNAKGKWIAFLDSDDIWDKYKLEKQINFMEQYDYHFSFTKYDEIDEANNPLNIEVTGPRVVNKRKMFNYCYLGCLTVMYDSDIVGIIQINNNIAKRNDYALWLKVIKKIDKCYYLDENLASYRKRNKSISSGSKFKLIKYHYYLFRNSENMNWFMSIWHTFLNLIYGSMKKMFYVKKKRGTNQ